MNKQERVYSVLRERVLTGQYGPGFRLVIDRIADDFGVSALPVREAVRRMEAEGLVVFRANAGAQVTPADPSQYQETMTVLAVLEGYATAEAAQLMTAEDLAVLDAKNDAMVLCMEQLDVLGFAQANQDFHRLIYESCGNAPLLDLLRSTERRLDAIRRTVFTHIPYRGLRSIEEHRMIVGLIRDGAGTTEIETAARGHKLKTLVAFHEWMVEHPGQMADTAAVSRIERPGLSRTTG
jgi:DNA-binding GntR family transcriptional regulator